MQSREQDLIAAVIMAAGKGTRMKSDLAKVLHPVLGRPMLFKVLESLKEVDCQLNVLVIGHQGDKVKEACADFTNLTFAEQPVQLGTGHALQCALPRLDNFNGRVLILSGDMPLISKDVLHALIDSSINNDEAMTLLSANSPEHKDFGRIIRTPNGEVDRIVEAKDCTTEEYQVTEVNLGAYCAKADFLRQYLPLLQPSNAQKELYLTDLIKLGREAKKKIGAVVTEDIDCALGVNSRFDLAKATQVLKERKLRELMLSGVSVLDPQSTWIEEQVEIAPNTEIWPGTILTGKTIIGSGCVIGPHTQIKDSVIGEGSYIVHSVLDTAKVEDNVKIGPFAYLRPQAHISSGAKVGDFVEIKNSNIGEGTKVPHLTYIGDTDIGKRTNIGCGTITCNYDGKLKHRTTIGDDVFIGSNSSLVAPVTVGSGAKTGAGAVVTHNIPEGSVVIGVPARPM